MRLLAPALLLATAPLITAEQYDVLVYGATPAGIAAAVSAAESGEKVLLVYPEMRVGGMVANGLTHTDFRTFEGLTGAFLRFSRQVEENYRAQFGDEAGKVSFRGTHAEPKVNQAVFEKMLAAQSRITVKRRWALEGVKCSSDSTGDEPARMKTVEVALFADENGGKHPVPARYFIDATYEGDLMAAAGVAYAVGRESRRAYGESLAPEEPDNQLQAYNFRLTMTREPTNRVPVRAPDNYNREDYMGVLPLLENGTLTEIFGTKPKQIYKAQTPPLPNGKYDINDMSHGPVRLSLPGMNLGWPDGKGGVAIRDGATDAIAAPPFSRTGLAMARHEIFALHQRWNLGLLYFLQNDESVPERFRNEAREWGLCKDEFTDTAHLPEQLYVREGRRMIGTYVFSENDTNHAENDARAVLKRDSIAFGDYGPNCHGTARIGDFFSGKHTGEFYKHVAPYQIPYGVMVPVDVDNLLVPVAASSTHVGFCALRMEPMWMALGEAAGHAVHLAHKEKVLVQEVPIRKLQSRLHSAGAGTIYLGDVLPGHPDFAAVQWWGTAGGFHGLAPTPEPQAIRGAHLLGQYFAAFPHHAAELDRELDEPLARRWTALAGELAINPSLLPTAGTKTTRGEWLRAAWKASSKVENPPNGR